MISVVELFSGVGAQRMALRNIGVDHTVECVCEIDKYAHRSYEAIHGETPNLGDISAVDKLPEADLWTYSFPCTDLSLAGKQAGMDRSSGTRSGLLWEVERLLKTAQEDGSLPKYLLMENVKPLVGDKFIGSFNEWQSVLWDMGYRNFWKVLNAKDYGVPQNRERVFMVSVLGETDGYAFPTAKRLEKRLVDMLEQDVDEKYYLTYKAIEYMNRERNGKPRWEYHSNDPDGVASCIPAVIYKGTPYGVITPKLQIAGHIVDDKMQDHAKRIYSPDGLSPTIHTMQSGGTHPKILADSPRRLTPQECWRLMGFTDEDFHAAEAVNSNSQLYKQAGNSIVVPVLEAIFRSLLCDDPGDVEPMQTSFL